MGKKNKKKGGTTPPPQPAPNTGTVKKPWNWYIILLGTSLAGAGAWLALGLYWFWQELEALPWLMIGKWFGGIVVLGLLIFLLVRYGRRIFSAFMTIIKFIFRNTVGRMISIIHWLWRRRPSACQLRHWASRLWQVLRYSGNLGQAIVAGILLWVLTAYILVEYGHGWWWISKTFPFHPAILLAGICIGVTVWIKPAPTSIKFFLRTCLLVMVAVFLVLHLTNFPGSPRVGAKTVPPPAPVKTSSVNQTGLSPFPTAPRIHKTEQEDPNVVAKMTEVGVPPDMWAVAVRESDLNQFERGTDGQPDPSRVRHPDYGEDRSASGVFQIKPSTAAGVCHSDGNDFDINTIDGNVRCAMAIYQKYGIEAWRPIDPKTPRTLLFTVVVDKADWMSPIKMPRTAWTSYKFDKPVQGKGDDGVEFTEGGDLPDIAHPRIDNLSLHMLDGQVTKATFTYTWP